MYESIEIIKIKDKFQIRVKISETYSYIIEPDETDKIWMSNIESMVSSMINKNN